MLGCKPTNAPIEQNHRLVDDKDEATGDWGMYQRLVGTLIYLSHTRLDIAYAVSVIIQFMHSPKNSHLEAIYRILKYLTLTFGEGILFKRNMEPKFGRIHWCILGIINCKTKIYLRLLHMARRKPSYLEKQKARCCGQVKCKGRIQGYGTRNMWTLIKIILDDLKIKWEGTMKLYYDNKLAFNIAPNSI